MEKTLESIFESVRKDSGQISYGIGSYLKGEFIDRPLWIVEKLVGPEVMTRGFAVKVVSGQA